MTKPEKTEPRWVAALLVLFAAGLTLFQLLTASPLWIVSGYKQAGIHWAFIAAVFLLSKPTKGRTGPVVDFLLLAASLACVYGLFSASDTLANASGLYSRLEVALAICQIFLALIIGYKALGKALPLIAIVFLLYTLYGNKIPGMFKTAKVSLSRLAPYLLVGSEGMFGTALVTCSRFIFIFIFFGAVLDLIGAGSFFVDLAFSLTGRAKGGAAQASIYSSMLMGMISGSGPANVVTTGTFTIPLMKKIGFDKDTAGAVEAVASGGGQIMPPVMGSVAFIMSEVTGIAYGQIALAALVPAVLYYLTLSSSVLVYSWKYNVSAADMEIKKPGEILKSGWYYLIPLAVLIGLMILGISAQRCALWAALTAIAVGVLFRRERLSWENISKKLVGTARGMATISAACLLAGIITGCINITGFGLKVNGIIELISGGSLLLMLVLTMVVCLILGMGLPTSASYVVLSVLVAPVIIKMGVAKLAVHLFILHFGSIATLTPPVALAVFAACGISGGTLWRTGGQAMKLAAAGLIVPFVFVYNNELLLMGEPGMIFFAIGTALLGCVLLSLAIIGWLFRDLDRLQRLAFLACGIALILPRPLWANAAGLLAGGLLVLWNWSRRAINQKQKGETL